MKHYNILSDVVAMNTCADNVVWSDDLAVLVDVSINTIQTLDYMTRAFEDFEDDQCAAREYMLDRVHFEARRFDGAVIEDDNAVVVSVVVRDLRDVSRMISALADHYIIADMIGARFVEA